MLGAVRAFQLEQTLMVAEVMNRTSAVLRTKAMSDLVTSVLGRMMPDSLL